MHNKTSDDNTLIPVRNIETGLCGYINTKGEVAIEAVYKQVNYFINGYAIVMSDTTDLFGIIDQKGQEIIPCQYSSLSINQTSDCILASIWVESNNWFYGFISYKNEILIPFEYEAAYNFYDRVCVC